MSAKIRLIPGGETFLAERHESILNAALRGGLALNYGCISGTCGRCLARVIDGQVEKINFHDFVISEADKTNGYVLLCANSALSDCTIEADVAHRAEEIPLQQLSAKVRKLERPTEDMVVLRLRSTRSNTLRFLAGQRALVRLQEGIARDLPIASCPCDAMNLEFHIGRNEGDPFTEYVFNQLAPGQEAAVEGPRGEFTLDEDWTGPILLIAVETGFAPIRSLMEHAISLELNQPIHIYWLVRRPHRHYLNNYCRSVTDALDNFRYTPLAVAERSQGGDAEVVPNLMEALRRITRDHPDLGAHQIYLAAPREVVADAIEVFNEHGLREARLTSDIT